MSKRIDEDQARANVASWCPSFNPTTPFPGASKPWEGECLECGARVSPQYSNLSQGRGACPKCGHSRRGLATRISQEEALVNVALWAPSFLPSVPYPTALEPWDGVCIDCGNSVSPTYHGLQQGRGHCWNCGQKRSAGARRLSDETARINAALWAPNFSPSVPYPGNNQTPWLGTCLDCGREVKPRYGNLQQGSRACLYCTARSTNNLRGHTNPSRVDPQMAHQTYMESGGSPAVPYPGRNNVPWPGTCNACGKEISPTWASIRRNGAVCNYCAKKASGLSTRHSVEFVLNQLGEWGFEPVEQYPGRVMDPWLVRHVACGTESRKSYNNLQQGHGCPECIEYFYSLDKPGFFYVVASEKWIKPGITNVPKRRFVEHRMQGLGEVVHLLEFPDGRKPLELEKRWLRLRFEQVPRELWATVDDLPNGFTEAVRRRPSTEDLILCLIGENSILGQ
jgi:recombinational DNA repair protein (RecF pathway)